MNNHNDETDYNDYYNDTEGEDVFDDGYSNSEIDFNDLNYNDSGFSDLEPDEDLSGYTSSTQNLSEEDFAKQIIDSGQGGGNENLSLDGTNLIDELTSLYGNKGLSSVLEGRQEDNITGTSSSALQSFRFSFSEERVRAFAYNLINDPDLTGQKSLHEKINPEFASTAVKSFGKTIGKDPKSFLSELKTPSGTEPTTVLSEQMQVLKMLGETAEGYEVRGNGGLLPNTYSTEEQQKIKDEEFAWMTKRLPEIADLYIREGTKATRASNYKEGVSKPDLYARRLAQTTTGLYKWLQTPRSGNRVIDPRTGLTLQKEKISEEKLRYLYNTSKTEVKPKGALHTTTDIYASGYTPLPNELGIFGLKQTAKSGNTGGFDGGSPFTTKEYEALYPTVNELTHNGKVSWDKNIYAQSEASNYDPELLRKLAPNKAVSLFGWGGTPETDDYYRSLFGEEHSELNKAGLTNFDALSALNKDMKKLSRIIRENTKTHLDISYGNQLRSTQLGMSKEQSDNTEYWNEARILDLDMHSIQTDGTATNNNITGSNSKNLEELINYKKKNKQSVLAETNLAEIGSNSIVGIKREGSYRGDMYGDVGLSETDRYVQLRSMGFNTEEAYAHLSEPFDATVIEEELKVKSTNVEGLDSEGSPDRRNYLKRIREGKLKGLYPDQRSIGWHKQREGLITGSMTSGLTPKKDVQKKLASIALDMVNGKDYIDSDVVKTGRENEELALNSFKAKTGLQVEEAYFETDDEIEGFGATPDGTVFDRNGKSQGLLELKVHTSEKAMLGGLKRYTNQLQMQMAITGEQKVHFYRINSDTESVLYDVVERDEEQINRIIENGKKVLGIRDAIVSKGNLTEEEQVARTIKSAELLKARASDATVYNKGKAELDVATVYGFKEGESVLSNVEKFSERGEKEDVSYNLGQMDTNTSMKTRAKARRKRKEEKELVFEPQKDDTSVLNDLVRFMSKRVEEVSSTANLGQMDGTKAHKEALKKKEKREKELNDISRKAREEEAENISKTSSMMLNTYKKVLATVMGVADGMFEGNSLGISTMIADEKGAIRAGMTTETFKGQQQKLKEFGLDKGEASELISQGANLKMNLTANPIAITGLSVAWGTATRGQSTFPSLPQFQGKSYDEMLPFMAGVVKKASHGDKGLAATLSGIVHMSNLTSLVREDAEGSLEELDNAYVKTDSRVALSMAKKRAIQENTLQQENEIGTRILESVDPMLNVWGNRNKILNPTTLLGFASGTQTYEGVHSIADSTIEKDNLPTSTIRTDSITNNSTTKPVVIKNEINMKTTIDAESITNEASDAFGNTQIETSPYNEQ